MITRLSVSLALGAALLLALCAGAASGSTPVHKCGRIDINYPKGGGGASAIGIRAKGLACRPARRIVRACMKGTVRSGWTARTVSDHSVYRVHVSLVSGQRSIRYHPAGGGGCS
jgi:hypothetical protein